MKYSDDITVDLSLPITSNTIDNQINSSSSTSKSAYEESEPSASVDKCSQKNVKISKHHESITGKETDLDTSNKGKKSKDIANGSSNVCQQRKNIKSRRSQPLYPWTTKGAKMVMDIYLAKDPVPDTALLDACDFTIR